MKEIPVEMSSRGGNALVHRGFKDFACGRFEDGGGNLYVNAKGVIETIHRTDVNNDGYVDIVIPNCQGYIERGPTWIYKPQLDAKNTVKDWPRREMPNDSGWRSLIIDVDGDGYNDLIVVNGENGVTSELMSYIYWGGPNGLTGERTEFATIGAYDVAVTDITGNGCLDLIFPSAWVDHHNPGRPLPIKVFLQNRPRQFEDATERFGLVGIAATAVDCADLTGNGYPDLVVGNYRREFEYDIESFVYWGNQGGFDADHPLRLPSHFALQALLADLNGDGWKEIIFTGGDQVWIYWNDHGRFCSDNRTIIESKGVGTDFVQGGVHAEVADVDGDGQNELILATQAGVEIRRADDLQKVQIQLPLTYASRVHAADLDGDGRPELIVSRFENRGTYETESAVFWNSSEGFSAERASWLPTTGARACTTGDLDNDGKPVIVFNNTMQGLSPAAGLPVYIYLGSQEGDYSVERRLDLPTELGSSGYIIADLDLDGYHDLAMVTQGVRIFHGGPQGPKPDRYTDLMPEVAGGFQQLLAADINRDGYLDLIALATTYDKKPESMGKSTRIFYGSPEGYSLERSEVLPTYATGYGHLADLSRNGYLDLIISTKEAHLLVFHGGPDGFSPQRVSKIMLDVPCANAINSADINKNGYLDLVIGLPCHYERRRETFYILYGGPDGYSLDNAQKFMGGYTPGMISIADYDNDGNLDLLVGAYSTDQTRELPAKIFRGDGQRIDLDNPIDFHADAAFQIMALDLSRNGYLDLFFACHRNDLGHQVDSLIFWNGPEGLSWDRTTRLPGMGPHFLTSHDFGNAYTRQPLDRYISPPFDLAGQVPMSLHWDAQVPPTTQLKFQLRWADSKPDLERAPWCGPAGEGAYYEASGQPLKGLSAGLRYLQYRAEFVSLYGCVSPQLREVRIECKH